MKTIASVCSARPNFVKLAAVHHALAARGGEFRHVLVHTGQHYDPLLSDVFFTQLGIPQPDFNLAVRGGTREETIEATKRAFADVLPEIKPDIVLVYGDVNGAAGAAHAAKEAGVRVGHVEAGLRSGDRAMPEEHNRIAIDRIADLLFCSEESGMRHLSEEKIDGRSFLVGNTMIDTLMRMMPSIERASETIARDLGLPEKKAFAVATIHRPSNVDDPAALRAVMHFLSDVANECPVVLPPHPRLKNALSAVDVSLPHDSRLRVLDSPLAYLDFLGLMKAAAFVLTDSGGIQEEAVLLRKRCFTLRRNTERPSTIESGSNVLIDPSDTNDVAVTLDFARSLPSVDPVTPPFWDGKTGERIAEVLAREC